jgi:hypothetical protein
MSHEYPDPSAYLDQYVRCYTDPNTEKIERRKRTRHPKWARRREREADTFSDSRESGTPTPNRRHLARRRTESDEAKAIKRLGAPYEGWCLVFDTETTTDTTQALRFGIYEVHGIDRDTRMRLHRQGRLTRDALDSLHEAGVFYDSDVLSSAEVALIREHAHERGLACLSRDEFVARFYHWAVRMDALVIGHNLPFDLSRLATDWTDAAGEYRGGFTLKLCRCPHGITCFDHPPIRIKMLGRYKARIAFQKVKPLAARSADGKQGNDGRKSRFYATRPVVGKFLDTATLGRALLGPGDTSLAGLGRRFKVATRKMTTEEHGGPLTAAYLDYARQDVAATWALYQAERELYRRHGVSKPMWTVYSEASLGKAYLQELGIPPFLRAHPGFPPEVHGYGMVAYYGGRSEVHIRLRPVEVLYCDFKSQYPTVNALMGLQDLLLAERVEVRDATAEVRALLEGLTLDQLQSPDFWRRLRVLVKIRPDHDLLPVRADYGKDGRNIHLTYLTGPAIWYTLADVLASTLLTGKAPEVVEALELMPSEGHVQTRPWRLFGDERYTIDLARQDFFTEVINLRTEVKAEMRRAMAVGRQEEAGYVDGLQLALKLLANSTSYGVLVEVNAEEPVSEPRPVTVYDWRTHEAATPVVERPGTYFAGAVGALIPAGGRLLLAIAERLAADRGITYAMCDTDSMAFARPDGMARSDFRRAVGEIRDWFTPLSPYRGQPPLFEDEDVNQWRGEPEPLYFLGVSAKRYALYNLLPDGTHRIRKFSSHGVGTWNSRAGYVSPPHIPEPVGDVHVLGGERWHYDLWYGAIAAIDCGTLVNGLPLPRDERGVPQYTVPESAWLDTPAFHQVTISTPHLYRLYGDVPGIRPFNFITVLPALNDKQVFWRQRSLERAATEGATTWDAARAGQATYEGLAGVSFYAPFARTAADLREVRRADTHELVAGILHRTLAESLRDYYRHPEWKAGDPEGVGVLPRRHVVALRHLAIGKESNRAALAAAEETDGVVGGEDAGMDGAQVFDTGDLSEILRRRRVADLIRTTGLPRRTIYDLRNGTMRAPSQDTLAALARDLPLLDPRSPPHGGEPWHELNH